jgi:gliding motility-associated-like protein
MTGEFEEVIVQLISAPQNGTLILNIDGTFTYEVINPLAEADVFVYEICAADCPEICATATVNLIITLDDIIIPDAISPNGDGLNDTWIIPGLLERDIRKMVIINRWGVVLFSTESYENDWNGNNKKGKPLPEGTYYYYLYMGPDFGSREGPITIIR